MKKIIIMLVGMIFIISCAHKKGKNDIETQKVNKEENLKKEGYMRVAFTYPVVMVNGKRAKQEGEEYQERIIVSFPENSTQNITLHVIDANGEEKVLKGKIKIYKYTSYSKPEGEEGDIVLVAPSNPKYTYNSILRNGYGEFTVKEKIREGEEEKEGAVLVKLFLGSKKKSSNEIEFRFKEGSVYQVDGHSLPYYIYAQEGNIKKFTLSIDEGNIELSGELQVLKSNFYTQIAPVWINLDEKAKSYLRQRGGKVTLALYVPSKIEEEYNPVYYTERDPVEVAKEKGTLIAILKLKRKLVKKKVF